jgi:hypothetical protein
MLILGDDVEIEHCQHCSPRVWWVEFDPGKPPQFAYTGFPKDGQCILSKNRWIVLCRSCVMPGVKGACLQ